MKRTQSQLRDDALAIWRAGVEAVDSSRLVREHIRVEGDQLILCDQPIALHSIRRIAVVGAGKAGAGMSAGLETALGDRLAAEKQMQGWVNVPSDCVRSLPHIKLHASRPAGVNEPTAEGVAGAERILDIVASLKEPDLCICLLSGGGSALLPAPVTGITLADKQAVTKHLSGAGANIHELNTVRKQLSRIKGGGLARACRAGRLVTLIISDVVGDPLDVIASGPTVPDTATAADALAVLDQFAARQAGIADRVFEVLERASRDSTGTLATGAAQTGGCRVANHLIGNNATAVEAARVAAVQRGYQPTAIPATRLEGLAEDVGRELAASAARMCAGADDSDCLISGGEPVVQLVSADRRGMGGRNQQLVLAALEQLAVSRCAPTNPLGGIVLLSGGTDGEDGPTDAAGAFIDAAIFTDAQRKNLTARSYLERNDAYHFFEPLNALIKTGLTHTNVCDVRVVAVSRSTA